MELSKEEETTGSKKDEKSDEPIEPLRNPEA